MNELCVLTINEKNKKKRNKYNKYITNIQYNLLKKISKSLFYNL